MQLKDFHYDLPPDLIAQEPTLEREEARLMTLNRANGDVGEKVIADIAEFFGPGDLLVINDTRVIPARLLGSKETGGRAEVFLVRRLSGPGEVWQCLIKASKRPAKGTLITLPEGVAARVMDRGEGETWNVSFSPEEGFLDRLEKIGSMPLPPYIRRAADADDRERYQTVFARAKGAVAAPTAGLHFTESLLQKIRQRGAEIVPLTLHVGLGTFMPIRVHDLSEHRMHREHYQLPEATAQAVTATKKSGGRVIALGTTSARALEHAADTGGTLQAKEGEADIFILPGYNFKVVDALITNFHLPESTLLMLVSAFAGQEKLYNAYAEAIKRKFRFFSYGDAMFIY